MKHVPANPGRPTWAEVDLDAIAANVRALCQAAPGAQLMAVVKANAYGHGAVPVARAALAAGARWLGVAIAQEALELVQAGVQAPILVLGWVPPEQAPPLIAAGVRLTVFTTTDAHALSEMAAASGQTVRVHLKVDTGMGRLGFAPDAAGVRAMARAAQLPGLAVEGLFTHFASADESDLTYTHEQLHRFHWVKAELAALGLRPRLLHAANTAGILAVPEAHLDLVRAGIGVYGYLPSPETPRTVPLRPALAWKTRVALVKRLPRGHPVSYGRTWQASGNELILTLPVGYADGYARQLSNRGRVLVHGREAQVVGRVCMDQMVVAVPSGEVVQGDEVTLLGRQGQAVIDAAEMAAWLGTIPYEVLCAISARVPRIYVGGPTPGDAESATLGLT